MGMEPYGSITDPTKFLELPFAIMERAFAFVTAIMQQSFEFATTIGRIIVGG